uniref:G-protein coupled receptors family 1 profile domain-containing protein n=1 Tax=Octopus bimaculoides TaxID=37653 RepID=A0A0L8GI93_OCTBM
MKQSHEETIELMNDKKTKTLLPVIIVLFFIMLFGFIGNCFFVYIHPLKSKYSPSGLPVVFLGWSQILECVLHIPMNIFILFHSYNFPDDIVCRFMQAVIFMSSAKTGMIVFTIAVDLFKKVCWPFKPQFTSRYIKKIICCNLIVLTFVLAGPGKFRYIIKI